MRHRLVVRTAPFRFVRSLLLAFSSALLASLVVSAGPATAPATTPVPAPPAGNAHGAAAAGVAVAPVAKIPDEPVCIGWDQGWVVYRYSIEKAAWSVSDRALAVLPRKVHGAIGPRAVAVIDPLTRYSGWLFDLQTSKWAQIPISPIPGHRGVMDPIVEVFAGDKLIVWGLTQGPPHGAILDTKTLKWTPMSEAPIRTRYRCLHAVIGNKLLVWGGYPNSLQDGAVFDLDRNAWTPMAAAPVPFGYGTVSAVWGERWVVFGGGKSRTGAVFDPATDKWEITESAPFDIGGMSACAVSGDQLFLWSGHQRTRDAVYDLVKRQWLPTPAAPIRGRALTSARAVGKQIVVWGGWVSDDRFIRDGAVYDLDRKIWLKIPDVPGDVPSAIHPSW